jgi:hypothetical protein
MRKNLILAVSLIFLCNQTSFAQKDSTQSLTFSGYFETYFAYDFDKPSDGNRPSFFYNYNRHKEVNINLAFIKAAYADANTRANVALMAGTYTSANLSAEPSALQNILEANAGIKLAKKANFWLDMGVFSSHIGFESAIGKDCWNLTRSLAAENSPYFETGAKVTFIPKKEKWLFSLLLLNGWQQIYRPISGNALALGTQIQWKPNSKWTLNSSTFYQNNTKKITQNKRFFHNFYATVQPTEKFGCTFGLDNGVDDYSSPFFGTATARWFTTLVVMRIAPTPKFSIAARLEFFQDKQGRIVSVPDGKIFKADSFSTNLDVKIRKNAVWRTELRKINNVDSIFVANNRLNKSNLALTTAIAVSF